MSDNRCKEGPGMSEQLAQWRASRKSLVQTAHGDLLTTLRRFWIIFRSPLGVNICCVHSHCTTIVSVPRLSMFGGSGRTRWGFRNTFYYLDGTLGLCTFRSRYQSPLWFEAISVTIHTVKGTSEGQSHFF